jgi:hypothetical protein
VRRSPASLGRSGPRSNSVRPSAGGTVIDPSIGTGLPFLPVVSSGYWRRCGSRRTRALLGVHHLTRRRRTADRENLVPRVLAVEPIDACDLPCVAPEVLEAFQGGLIEGP